MWVYDQVYFCTVLRLTSEMFLYVKQFIFSDWLPSVEHQFTTYNTYQNYSEP